MPSDIRNNLQPDNSVTRRLSVLAYVTCYNTIVLQAGMGLTRVMLYRKKRKMMQFGAF